MRKSKAQQNDFTALPSCAAEFIKLVIKKMRYRKKVRADVQAELIAHFEDALKDCASEEEKQQKAEKLIADFGDAKLLGVLARRAKKRCRPMWRTMIARTFQTIGVLFICLVLYCVYISLGVPTITVNYVDQINRLAQPVADESLNAAPLYQKAIDLCKEPPKIEGIELLKAIGDKDWVGRLAEDEISALRRWISSNIEALDYFIQASEKPHCWWRRQAKDDVVLNVLIPGLSSTKELAKLNCWRAKLRAYNGQVEEAFDDLLVCYKAGRHFKGPRTLIEQLVGMAIQQLAVRSGFVVLDRQEVDAQLLRTFQKRLEYVMAEDIYIADFQVERFMYHDIIQRSYTDDGRGSGRLAPAALKGLDEDLFGVEKMAVYGAALGVAVISADRRTVLRKFEDTFDKYEDAVKKTPWQLKQEHFDDWERAWFEETSRIERARCWMYYILMPHLSKVGEQTHRQRLQSEALITTIALLRWYKGNSGVYPVNLDELLAAGYIKELPMDPYSDQPLVYKRVGDGFTLYSLGADFDDDGGVPSKWGRGDEGGDRVFWPVAKPK